MKAATALYRLGTGFEYEGATFDMLVVDTEEVADREAEGWFRTTTEARGDAPPAGGDAPPTREELEIKARMLGIEFTDSTRSSTLMKRIAEKLGAT